MTRYSDDELVSTFPESLAQALDQRINRLITDSTLRLRPDNAYDLIPRTDLSGLLDKQRQKSVLMLGQRRFNELSAHVNLARTLLNVNTSSPKQNRSRGGFIMVRQSNIGYSKGDNISVGQQPWNSGRQRFAIDPGPIPAIHINQLELTSRSVRDFSVVARNARVAYYDVIIPITANGASRLVQTTVV
jgi:hypothetical protein